MISENQVKKYCREDISLIENYEKAINDNTQTWDCHHRKESQYSVDELVDIGEYYNRPACELIFLTPFDHRRLHKLGKPTWIKGKHHSEESRKKIAEALKGKHHSAEAKKKMSLRHKERGTWMTGTHWYNNGVESIQAKTCPEGFVPGRIVCNKRA